MTLRAQLNRGRGSALFLLMALAEQTEGPPTKVIEEVKRMGEIAATTRTPVDSLAWSQMVSTVIPAPQLQEWLAETYKNLISMPMENDPTDKVFANAGIHIVRRAAELLHRIKLPSVSLQLASDSNFATKSLAQIQGEANAAGETIFASSEGLYDGIFTLDAYLTPLYGALVPAIWAFPAPRMLGVIIYSLGQPVAGSRGRAAELLHLLPSQGPTESSSIPTLSPAASSAAIRWWVNGLNDLLGVLSDPTVFTDCNGKYVPAAHLHAQLSVDQLFRRVASMEISLRDAQARRVLFFTILDTIERLTTKKIERICSLKYARNVLARLRSEIPAGAAEVLLPGAERGVEALERLQHGFFIQRRQGSAQVEWFDPEVGPRAMEIDEATAHYVRLLRDATHGHGAKAGNRKKRTDALLTNHNGKIPHDLGWLGYLYLLDFLARPDDLRQRLYDGGKI